MTLLVFGPLPFILYNSPTMDTAPPALVEAGARAYGVPALLAGCAIGIILRKGAPVVRDRPESLGRILVMAVLPETAAIFALLISIQVYGRAINSGFTAGLMDAAGRASLYISLASLGALIEGILIVTAWDFRTPVTFSRALLRAVAAEPLMIIGLVLAMTSLAGAG